MKSYYVYIVTNKTRTVVYTGITNHLERRILEHYLDRGNTKSFAGRYKCHHVVFFDWFDDIDQAIAFEKRIKGKSRKWKNDLIEEHNPDWDSLNHHLFGYWPPDEALVSFL